jgi:hypothetical protein
MMWIYSVSSSAVVASAFSGFGFGLLGTGSTT